MKSISGMKRSLPSLTAGVLLAALLPVSSAFAVSAFPSSGSCAMLVTQPVPVGATVPFQAGYNIIAVLTFTSATGGTIDYAGTHVNYTSNGYTVVPSTAQSSGTGIPFAVAALAATAPSAARSITFTPTGSATPIVANAIAVNGGSTVLIQGASDAFSGVCQF
ncbi:MAG: hypothetical protein OEW21_18975 [Betaproteobacteria bacterium]|nr:hypothetical protein [Betaproteobacteria bacterium]